MEICWVKILTPVAGGSTGAYVVSPLDIEQVSMISLQNTRDKRVVSMPNKPCFLPRSIRIDKTVRVLKLACKI